MEYLGNDINTYSIFSGIRGHGGGSIHGQNEKEITKVELFCDAVHHDNK